MQEAWNEANSLGVSVTQDQLWGAGTVVGVAILMWFGYYMKWYSYAWSFLMGIRGSRMKKKAREDFIRKWSADQILEYIWENGFHKGVLSLEETQLVLGKVGRALGDKDLMGRKYHQAVLKEELQAKKRLRTNGFKEPKVPDLAKTQAEPTKPNGAATKEITPSIKERKSGNITLQSIPN